MFITALLIIAKTWKQPRCPSVGEWVNCGTSRQWNVMQCLKTKTNKKTDQKKKLSSHETYGKIVNAYY